MTIYDLSEFDINKRLANLLGLEVQEIDNTRSTGMTAWYHHHFPHTVWVTDQETPWRQFCATRTWEDIGPTITRLQVSLSPESHDGREGTENSERWMAIPVIERMKAQLMVAGHIASIIEAPGLSKTGFITDRTPIDVMAHTHDIAAPHYKNDEVMELYTQTHMVCTETTIANFNLSLILRPGVPLTEEDHQRKQRGSLNPFYVNHMDMLMSSFILSFSKLPNRGMLSRFAFMKDEVIDLDLRVESLTEVVNTIATDSEHSCEPIH